MHLGKTIVHDLQQYLVEQQGVNDGKERDYIFNQNRKNLNFQFAVRDFDTFSLLLENIEIRISKESPELHLNRGELMNRAKFLIENVTYLLENLQEFEIDPINLEIQLRSILPQNEEASAPYFEMIMRGGKGSISLERILFDKETKQKRRIPFHLTSEVLEILLNDLVTAIQHHE